MTLRARILALAARADLEEEARVARRLTLPRAERRNRREDDRLALFLALWLPVDANCIDVGAHRGSILERLVSLAPSGAHIAYEPLPELADYLGTRFPAVDVRQRALSDESGRKTFLRAAKASRSGLDDLGEAYTETIEVDVDKLDDVVDSARPPAFIKVDVEGAELRVFRGAAETLIRHRPIVAFEHGAAARKAGESGASASAELHELLSECGLRIFDLDGYGPYSRDGLENAERWNFVAHL
jgi:FkbM family methyltransferase